MALEDFFTLTEMKDGLTASTRVKELVNIMIEERDCAVGNTSDATRHWYTVASTIAATEDKDCLDLFVQLDGILFINKWLEDVQKLGNEESIVVLLNAVEKLSLSFEKLIVVLLNAVEKLSLSYEKSVAYGTREIVEKLFSHSSVMVQEKAKAVFGRWKQMDDGEAITGQTMPSEVDIAPNIGVVINEEIHAKIDNDKADDIENCTNDEEKPLDHGNMKDEESVLKKPPEESLCSEGEHSSRHLEENPSDIMSTAAVPKEDGIVSNQFSDNEEQMQEVANSPDRLVATEVSLSRMEKDSEPVTGSNLQTDSDMNVENNLKEPATEDMRAEIPSSSNDNNAINIVVTPPNHSETMEASTPKIETPHTSSSSDTTNTEHSTSESEGIAKDTDFLKNKTKDNHVANKNMSDFELNYGMVDALEVARQVAIEVEREVEGRKETSCSTSSRKDPETQPTQPNSPVSVHGDETQTDENDPMIKPDKEAIDFDLNEEICCSDDTDQALDTTSTHVSIVSASRAAAAPGLPVTPLQFEGAHGWKGSATTSAFRPASPRKNHDIDTIDTNTKRNRNFLGFDLNMSEEGEDKAADIHLPPPQKQVFHSGESSGEGRVVLDLNRVSDEGDAPLSRFSERILLGRNSHHNASPSSSSSSMRNFDLNDQPAFLNDDPPELNFFASSLPSQSVGPRSNRNVISIMGAKVEVDRNHSFPQPPFLPNGRAFEPPVDLNFTRSGGILGIPYPVSGMFTYNGLANGPTGPIMYGPGGPIPYMVDSRGAPMPYSQPPFSGIYGMPPPGFSGPGPGPLRPNFDLNLGLNRESGVLRQFLAPGQSFQPSGSTNIGKRKEPDGGWEPYPFDYKHHQWK